MGGLAFTLSVLWSQILPFVALKFYEGEDKELITVYLVTSLALWVMMSIAFFCTIDLNFIVTFFDTRTGPLYTCEMFLNSEEDFIKYDAVFTNRLKYTTAVHGEVKDWVKENVERWQTDKLEWFQIELVDNEFLPQNVLEAEGGTLRKRKNSNFGGIGTMKMKSFKNKASDKSKRYRVHPLLPEQP